MNIGCQGEKVSRDYLISNGYKIISNNFRYRKGEIDIIASKNGGLVFIEVKTRRNKKYGLPREAVSISKQRNIYQTAKVYLSQKPGFYTFIRFDVIEVFFEEKIKINHIENAFDGNDLEE